MDELWKLIDLQGRPAIVLALLALLLRPLAEFIAGEKLEVLIGEPDVVALALFCGVPILAGLGEDALRLCRLTSASRLVSLSVMPLFESTEMNLPGEKNANKMGRKVANAFSPQPGAWCAPTSNCVSSNPLPTPGASAEHLLTPRKHAKLLRKSRMAMKAWDLNNFGLGHHFTRLRRQGSAAKLMT